MPTSEQDVRCLRNELHKRQLSGSGGVCFWVEKDRFNVGVTRNDVVVNRRRVEHRCVARKRVEHGEWIGEE